MLVIPHNPKKMTVCETWRETEERAELDVERGLKIQKRRRLQAKEWNKSKKTEVKLFQKITSVLCHLWQTGQRGNISVGDRMKDKDVQTWGELGWWWMPQKAIRYPPIHDQIDTPTHFSIAVRERMAGGDREKQRGERWAGRSPQLHDYRAKHKRRAHNDRCVMRTVSDGEGWMFSND